MTRRGRSAWEKIVAEYRASGLTHRAFCSPRGISVNSLRHWIYRLRDERAAGTVARSATKPVHMVPVRIRAPKRTTAESAGAAIVELLVGAVVMRVRVGEDVAYVAELASALAARC